MTGDLTERQDSIGRTTWIDRRPAAVVYALDAADVAAAIGYARQAGVGISVRGGGHNTSGSAVADGELMINLARLNTVTVDPEARRARVGGGALLSDFDAAAQARSTTSRAEVVTADGSVRWADEENDPDLFWAIRGGGGNFGVVTTFEFRLHPVGPLVNFGLFFWGLDHSAEALLAVQELARDLPRDYRVLIGGLNAPPAPFVPEEHRFVPGFALLLVGFGTPEDHAEQAERIRSAVPPLFELCTPMPYVALQQMQDEATRWGQFAYEKGTQFAEITDEVATLLTEQLALRTTPTSMVMLYLGTRPCSSGSPRTWDPGRWNETGSEGFGPPCSPTHWASATTSTTWSSSTTTGSGRPTGRRSTRGWQRSRRSTTPRTRSGAT